MRLHGRTWAALALAALVLLAANLWCWRPGIGGGGPDRPGGTEVELFFGFPATYRAESWRSEDPAFGRHYLERAPFFHPVGTMERQARYVDWLPVFADVAFGVAVLVVVGVSVESRVRGWWCAGGVALLAVGVAVVAARWFAAGAIAVHL
jgi:hypothetical protein